MKRKTVGNIKDYLDFNTGDTVVSKTASKSISASGKTSSIVDAENKKKGVKTDSKMKKDEAKSNTKPKSAKKQSSGKSSSSTAKKPASKEKKATQKKGEEMTIRVDFSTGIAYDIKTGKPLRDLYSDEEKKEYCDKKYGKGGWRKMSYSEVRERLKMDLELRRIAKSFDSDSLEDDYLEE